MSARNLAPSGEHASVAVYADHHAEADVFAEVCRTVQAKGGVFAGAVNVVAVGGALESHGELDEADDGFDCGPERLERLLAGQEPDFQVVEVGFEVPRVGWTAVSYEPARQGEQHPVAVTTEPGKLGGAETRMPRLRESSTARWLLELLRAICDELDPLYGQVGVEHTLPSPQRLRKEGAQLTTNLFVSERLLASDPKLGKGLRECFAGAEVSVWLWGKFFSGWESFNESGKSVTDPEGVGEKAAELLARSLRRVGTL